MWDIPLTSPLNLCSTLKIKSYAANLVHGRFLFSTITTSEMSGHCLVKGRGGKLGLMRAWTMPHAFGCTGFQLVCYQSWIPLFSVQQSHLPFMQSVVCYTNSHQDPASGQACKPPDPHWSFPKSLGRRSTAYPVPKCFFLFSVSLGSDFYWLHWSFFFLRYFTSQRLGCGQRHLQCLLTVTR